VPTCAAAIYLRTEQKNAADQEHELREVANSLGCGTVKLYRDDIGSNNRRPQLDKLRSDASNRKFDVLIAWSVGIARSLKELLGLLSEMHAFKIDLYVHLQRIDTTTPAGQAMLSVIDLFCELERAITLERLHVGRAKVRQYGAKLGAPNKTLPTVETAIRDALQKGDAGIIRIAKRFGVGTGTVQRIKADMKP
jgi:DNA invertase Pin-like site-specific DNA recombinase